MKVKKYTYDKNIENDKMEESIKGEELSDYMSFVADPIIFKNDNLIRLGFDPKNFKNW
jgi:hypothetical protein